MELICIALTAYWVILLARVILSWVQMAGSVPAGLGPVVRVIYELTEPVLGLFRRVIPPLGPLDISALFAFICLGILQGALGCGGLL